MYYTLRIHNFLLFTQDLELDPMTLFLSKFCNPCLFFKTPGALKPQRIQCRHQGRSVPSRKKLTPKRAPAVVAASPSSPVSKTRSKKQL